MWPKFWLNAYEKLMLAGGESGTEGR